MKIDGKVHLINDNGKQYYIDSENFKIYYDSGLKDLAMNDNPIVKTLVPLFSALTPLSAGVVATLLERSNDGTFQVLTKNEIKSNIVLSLLLFLITILCSLLAFIFQNKEYKKINQSGRLIPINMNKTLEKEIINRAVDSIKKGSNFKIGVLVLLILSLTGIALTSYLPFYLLSIASMFLTVLFIGADSNFFKKRIVLNDYIIKMKVNIIKK